LPKQRFYQCVFLFFVIPKIHSKIATVGLLNNSLADMKTFFVI